MPDFILLMHNDAVNSGNAEDWEEYLRGLSSKGVLRGGSEIGTGTCMRRNPPLPGITSHIVGYVKLEASDLDGARDFVRGNPVYEGGGTVEIRELPPSGPSN